MKCSVKRTLLSRVLVILPLLFLLASCSTGPQPLAYGEDACAYCRMTITEAKFGAEIVTKKGKVFKFDCLECMLNSVDKNYVAESEVGKYYICDAGNPGNFIELKTAILLHSDAIPSPMGLNVTSFSSKKQAEENRKRFGGEIISLESIKNKMKRDAAKAP